MRSAYTSKMRRTRALAILATGLVLLANVSAQQKRTAELDLTTVTITMKQENHCGCIGCGCASYVLTINGNGSVEYEGIAEVQIPGKFTYSIGRDRVAQIVDKFYEAGFFSMEDEYRSRDNGNGTRTTIDHTTPITLSITIEGKKKSVYDFFGAPERLKELERAVYDLSMVAPYATPKKSVNWQR